jgi:S1-C subfamily serine protease
MNKRWLWILIGVVAFCVVLFGGAVAGAGLTYLALQARPARAAQEVIVESINQVSSDYDAGVLVLHVDQGSPAAEAGIQRGDIILAVDDQKVDSMLEIMGALESKSAGEEVSFTVQHCETTEDLTVLLEERNGHFYLGLQFGRSRIFDMRPFEQGGAALPFDQPTFVITLVIPDSPADEAGLNPGDMIIAVDDKEFQSEDELADTVHSNQPGDEITLSIYNPGADEPHQIAVTLGENPDVEGQAYLGVEYLKMPGFGGVEGQEGPFFHFEIPKSDGERIPLPHLPEDIMPFMHELPQLPESVEAAIVINKVTPESPAAEAGLESGDVITAINDKEISGLESFVEAVRSFDPGDDITLTVYRNGEEESLDVEVVLGEDPEVDGQAYLGLRIGEFLRYEHKSPSLGSENPFHFEFRFPWHDGNQPENRIHPVPGEEA